MEKKRIIKSQKCEFPAVMTQVVVKSLAIYGTQIDSSMSYLDTVMACMCLLCLFLTVFLSFSCILFKVCIGLFLFCVKMCNFGGGNDAKAHIFMSPEFYHFRLKLPKSFQGSRMQHFKTGHIILMNLKKKPSFNLTFKSFSFRWR